MAYVTYLLGRGADCEIGVSDRTVSRRHAEILATDASLMIVDRSSKGGSWINEGDGWRRIQQAIPHAGAKLRFGDFETSLIDLKAAVRSLERAERPDNSPSPSPPPAPVVLKGQIRRNPETGEIEAH